MDQQVIRVPLLYLHEDQVKALSMPGRFRVIRAGRRWGKTLAGEVMACSAAIKGKSVGWFAPQFKFLSEAFHDIAGYLEPVTKTASLQSGVIRTITKGRVDFWSLENERAGRSRRYHLVVLDEVAFTKANMTDIWEKSIRPTLLDFRGSALVLSNTNGNDPENFMWKICNQPEYGFVDYHAPSHSNPFLPKDELEKLERDNHPLVFQQEYLAEFVDWSGVAFFSRDNLLVNKEPVEFPSNCDGVFAVIDTAAKTGSENDGTAVLYCARTKHGTHPLILLDYDLKQIEGVDLETWLPTVFSNLEAFARQCGARAGSLGVWIEDKATGIVLLQQAARRGWPARAIDSKLTALGKSERAISVSGHVYRGEVKISRQAYNRVLVYKRTSRNHLLGQIEGFRVGNKDQVEDDALDTFCYSIAIALGNSEGFA